jgi:hypothetical protein
MRGPEGSTRKNRLPAAAFVAAFALPLAAAAGTCAVPADHATLQAAFDDAACNPIQVAAGTYLGNFSLTRAVTVHGAGAGATILDGQNLGRVLTIDFPGNTFVPFTVVLTGLTFQHGNAHGTGFDQLVGGGIADFAGSLVVNDCDVSHNAASTQDDRTAGGGIYNDRGDLSLLHTTVTANTSGGFSGGIENESAYMVVADSIISGNQARTFSGGIGADGLGLAITRSQITNNTVQNGPGGGVTAEGGPLAIDHSIVSGNRAGDYGGGVVSEGGDLRMIACTVSNNTAAVERGGGVAQAGRGIVMRRSTVSGNRITGGGDGAGVSLEIDQGEPVVIENSTITGNTGGSGHGGGVFVSFSSGTTPSIVNATVAGNSATSAGGVFAEHRSSASTTVNLVNTIVAGNSGADCGGGLIHSLGHNLSKDSTCPFTASGDKRGVDPKLGALAVSFPGENATLALGAGSPAIDAGDDQLATSTDERGVPPGGAHVDIGAFEVLDPALIVIPVEEVDLRVVGGP